LLIIAGTVPNPPKWTLVGVKKTKKAVLKFFKPSPSKPGSLRPRLVEIPVGVNFFYIPVLKSRDTCKD
jgi:hypothetical protein